MFSSIVRSHTAFIIKKPIIVIVAVLAVVIASSIYIQNLNIDASPDSLMLENDPDLKYYRDIHSYYESDEFIIVGFKPNEPLLSEDSIVFISNLTTTLKSIDGISNVTSLTNIPLLLQRREDKKTGATTFANLLSKDVNIETARKEFASSAIYIDNIVNKDLTTTAIKLDIVKDEVYQKLQQRKYVLLDKHDAGELFESERDELADIRKSILLQRKVITDRYKSVLDSIREILLEHNAIGEFYLAGAPLVGNDLRVFVVKDVRTFGLGIVLVMMVVLFIFFRRISWMFLALACAILNVVLVSGIISLLKFQLTIISSNFVALLFIFSVALSIHLIIRYQETQSNNPNKNVDDNLKRAISQIVTPCFYMVITSATAFFSLIASDINPVITFGFMMMIGLFCAFMLTFTLLPALIKLIKPGLSKFKEDKSAKFLENLLNMIVSNKTLTMIIVIGLFILNLVGISQITVENRFIDYFKKSTDIYQGLELIDTDLGGTVPLEVMLEAPEIAEVEEDIEEEEDEFDDYLSDLDETQDDFTAQSYWYNRSGIKKIRRIHQYLEELPQIGKVLSLSSTEEVFRTVNKGEQLEDFHLSLVYSKVPENIKNVLLAPYLSADGSQARIIARIKDSDHTLIRNDLLNMINEDLNSNYKNEGESIRLTGISVLYNNVLQSLFRSQILTLGTVFLCILLMLMILFRNVKLAFIGIIPNIFTALFILGLMGIFAIPLDIMTITISAITIGIGVDYAIHYIHRYKKEFASGKDNFSSIHKSQTTVGKALYFTSITITLGFVILVLSNFVPSIYFGLLTSLAMLISLFATFSIIPLLLLTFEPLKKVYRHS